ncbi:MAG TPA: hypothetical protein VLG27_02040 [Candidatus Saccharimonadia bacterium]|nr:hypothetical protein [Candidatus Saccharimonadia bacterium]
MPIKLNSKGFAAVEAALIVLIVAIVAGTGYYVWHAQNKSTDDLNQANSESDSTAVFKKKSGKKTAPVQEQLSSYSSKVGNLTLKYPSSWMVSGFLNDEPVTNLTGSETQVRVQEHDDATKNNNFGGDFIFSSTSPKDTPYPLYAQGTIVKKLGNGIEVWQDKKSQTLATGPQENTCPTLQIASNGAFGFKLKNGQYIQYSGSFCWAERMTTDMTYEQQISSPEFKLAVNMLASITQN